jgi:hypothetical protein
VSVRLLDGVPFSKNGIMQARRLSFLIKLGLMTSAGVFLTLLSACQSQTSDLAPNMLNGLETAVALTQNVQPTTTPLPTHTPLPSVTIIQVTATAPVADLDFVLPVAPGFTPEYLLPKATLSPTATDGIADADATLILVATPSGQLLENTQLALDSVRQMRGQIEGALNGTPVNCRLFTDTYTNLSILPEIVVTDSATQFYNQAKGLALGQAFDFYQDCVNVLQNISASDSFNPEVWQPALQGFVDAEQVFLAILQGRSLE